MLFNGFCYFLTELSVSDIPFEIYSFLALLNRESGVKDFKIGQKWLTRCGQLVTITRLLYKSPKWWAAGLIDEEKEETFFTRYGKTTQPLSQERSHTDLVSLVVDKQ